VLHFKRILTGNSEVRIRQSVVQVPIRTSIVRAIIEITAVDFESLKYFVEVYPVTESRPARVKYDDDRAWNKSQ